MSTSSQPVSRRSFGKLAAVAAAAVAGGSALSSCATRSGTASPGAPLRVMAINHVWSHAISGRVAELEERIGRRVSITMLTADQLASSYNVKLNASGTDVDVMMVRALQEQLLFAHNGWLTDLTDRARGDTAYDWADFQDAPRERSVTDGRVLSIPVVTERPALYYRKDLVEEFGGPPGTLEDLLEMSLELADRRRGFFGYVGRGQRSGAVSQWSSFLYSFGGDFTVDGRSAIATPQAIAAYELYGGLLERTGPPGATNMSLEQAMPIFAQGKAAFYVDADAIYTNFLDPKISTVQDTVGFAPFPAGPAGSRPHNIPSWSLAVNEFSLLRDDAWEFIRWASSPEMVASLQAEGIPGARSSAWSDRATLTSFPADLAEAMRINAENGLGHDRPEVLQVGRARDIVGRPLVAGILGKSVPGIARDANAEFDDFLVRDNRHREPR
ncbi:MULTISPECIES: ABC transporter substrate-binding protein [Streptomyces]|uniref:Multiple sugar transport system substrate-binding protein n=2 Tax=Streptomyces TaxID=1883 RepID=A0A1I6QYV8_9ACTN|nr:MULTISPECIES: sugar ABC transporter substrate-binding protein [Streptomyces]MCK1815238.1 sugar ABC transporter substrate-binding protein [Streptomyces sp. XM4011]SFS57594.1 multiple sugar transport system substrate-binding protein [Streptomyces harbinensis]